MKVYKCFKEDFPELEKRIKRITKKLNTYGKKWIFENLGESIEVVSVWDYSNRDNVPSWQFHPKKVGDQAMDVISYHFEMESLKLGDFEVLAVIEHNQIENSNENIIHVIKEGENISIPLRYRTIKSHCEHCNSDRKRNKTVLLINPEGQIKQVGSTCIKEYTGIDGLNIIGNYMDIHSIILEELSMDYERAGRSSKYVKTLDYLTSCLTLIESEGYKKEETKYKAFEMTTKKTQNKNLIPLAQKIILYFENREFLTYETFLNNIKVYLSNEYTKANGIVAYAYLAYQKEIEKEEQKRKELEGRKNSSYVGRIGDKLEKELTLKKAVTYEASFDGYHEQTMHIFIFEDSEGNLYKWNTSSYLGIEQGESLKLRGSIKAYEEYNGQNQTVLTRCRIQ